MRRYIVASVVAVGLTIAGAIFVRATSAMVATFGGPDIGVELPSSTIWRIWLADLMIDFWWFLIPVVFIFCFGIAMLFRTRQPEPER
jgi:type II secretory pathway component PulF